MNTSYLITDVNGVGEAFTWEGNEVVITPSSLLAADTTYSVNVTAKDLAGNSVKTSWTFITMKDVSNIEGVIRDASGNPLAQATVLLSNGMKTTTEATGYFIFYNVTADSYNLTISKDGYQTLTYKVTASAANPADLGSLTMLSSDSTSDNSLVIATGASVVIIILGLGIVLFGRRKAQQ